MTAGFSAGDSVSDVTEKHSPQEIDYFLDDMLIESDPVLTEALRDSDAAGLPRIAVSVQQGKFLSLFASAIAARRVLEIGTLGGYSTIWLARGVGAEGRVVTLEYEPTHAEVARANLDRAGLGDRVEILVGAALETLPTVSGPFDLIFIDADKVNYPGYLHWAVKLSRPGSIIIVDNVIRDGNVLDGEDEATQAIRRTLTMIGQDPRLDAAALQTVGAKGWDGFAVAVVR